MKMPASALRLHYYRRDGRYAGWGLHVWGDTKWEVKWEAPLYPTGFDSYGTFWDIPLTDGAQTVSFIVHKGEERNCGELEVNVRDVESSR